MNEIINNREIVVNLVDILEETAAVMNVAIN